MQKNTRYGKNDDLNRQTAKPESGGKRNRKRSKGKEKLKRDLNFDDHIFMRQHVSFVYLLAYIFSTL